MKVIENMHLLIDLLQENKDIIKCYYQNEESSSLKTVFDTFLIIEYKDDTKTKIGIINKNTGFPKEIEEVCKKIKDNNPNVYSIILVPSLLEKATNICKQYCVGYLDSAGNCFINFDKNLINIKGNSIKQPKQRGLNSIYERSSVVSSKILRILFADINKKWKLSELSKCCNCSIGQVSKVKKFLDSNAQIIQDKEGIQLRNPDEVIKEWASVYHKKEDEVIECYTLDSVPEIERKLEAMKREIGVNYYLTGFSGGSRLQPVVRYHKVQCYIKSQDIDKALNYLECKKVKGGSNVEFIIPYDDSIFNFSLEKNGSSIVSPVQLYLDCVKLKNRGEELAEVILEEEILSRD